MLRRKSVFSYIFMLLVLLTPNPCFSMDPVEDTENFYAAPQLPKEEQFKSPSISTDPNNVIKVDLDNYIQTKYREFESSVFHVYKHGKPQSEHALFYAEQDRLFFCPQTSIKTRSLQVAGAIVFGAAPWAWGPLSMYICTELFGDFPVGPSSIALVSTVIAVSTLPFMTQGWKFGGKAGAFLFDRNGVTSTPTKADCKPHVQPEEYPFSSSCCSGLVAGLRTLPFAIIFWDAEHFFFSYQNGFIFPLCLSLFVRSYEDSMDFWNRLGRREMTENNRLVKLKKKILVDSKMRDLINSEDSDAIVQYLYARITERCEELYVEPQQKQNLYKALEDSLTSKSDIPTVDEIVNNVWEKENASLNNKVLTQYVERMVGRRLNEEENKNLLFTMFCAHDEDGNVQSVSVPQHETISLSGMNDEDQNIQPAPVSQHETISLSCTNDEDGNIQSVSVPQHETIPLSCTNDEDGNVQSVSVSQHETISLSCTNDEDENIQPAPVPQHEIISLSPMKKVGKCLQTLIHTLKLQEIKQRCNVAIIWYLLQEIERSLTDEEKEYLLTPINKWIDEHQTPLSTIVQTELYFNMQFKPQNIKKLVEKIDDHIQKEMRYIQFPYSWKRRDKLNQILKDYLEHIFETDKQNDSTPKEKFLTEMMLYIGRVEDGTDSSQTTGDTLAGSLQQTIITHLTNLLIEKTGQYFRRNKKSSLSYEAFLRYLDNKQDRASLYNDLRNLLVQLSGDKSKKQSKKKYTEQVDPGTQINQLIASKLRGEEDSFSDLNSALCLPIQSALSKALSPKHNQSFRDGLYDWLHNLLGGVKLDDGLWVEEKDMSLSAFSLLFLKPKEAGTQYKAMTKKLAKNVEKISQYSLKRSEEKAALSERQQSEEMISMSDGSASLPQSEAQFRTEYQEMKPLVEKAADVKVKKLFEEFAELPFDQRMRLQMIYNNLPQKPKGTHFLKKTASLLQGAATPGRVLLTLWLAKKIISKSGIEVNDNIILGAGIGVGGVDALCRIPQEWYMQQNTFLKAQSFASRQNDYWPLRWFTNTVSFVNAAFFTLPTISILFDLFPESPLYLKVLLAAATVPSDCASFFHFLQDKWDYLLRGTTTVWIKSTSQKRSYLNGRLDELERLIEELDAATTNKIFQDTQNAD